MDPLTIIALIGKGISVAEMLIDAGKSAAPAFTAVKNLISGAQSGTVTDADLTSTESMLDGLIDDFNTPIAD